MKMAHKRCPKCRDDIVGYICVRCAIEKQQSPGWLQEIDRVSGCVEITRIEPLEATGLQKQEPPYFAIYGRILHNGDWPNTTPEQRL